MLCSAACLPIRLRQDIGEIPHGLVVFGFVSCHEHTIWALERLQEGWWLSESTTKWRQPRKQIVVAFASHPTVSTSTMGYNHSARTARLPDIPIHASAQPQPIVSNGEWDWGDVALVGVQSSVAGSETCALRTGHRGKLAGVGAQRRALENGTMGLEGSRQMKVPSESAYSATDRPTQDRSLHAS